VLKDHCLEYHRYLPTGLHDPKVLGTLLIADTEAREFVDTAGQGNTFEIRDKNGKTMAQLSAGSPREMHAWIQVRLRPRSGRDVSRFVLLRCFAWRSRRRPREHEPDY